ncbi:MAG TPA: hypothetical protein VGE72_27090, partial [Azospirillum sp.]
RPRAVSAAGLADLASAVRRVRGAVEAEGAVAMAVVDALERTTAGVDVLRRLSADSRWVGYKESYVNQTRTLMDRDNARAAEQRQPPRWDLDAAVAVLANMRARASAWPSDLTEDQRHAAVDRWLADHGITAAEDSTLRRIEPANRQPGMLLDGRLRPPPPGAYGAAAWRHQKTDAVPPA